MKKFMILTLSVFMILGMAGLASASFTNIGPDDAYQMLYKGDITYLIDVRTPQEWSGTDYYDPRSGKGWKNTLGHPGYNGKFGSFLEERVFNISYQLFNYENNTRDANPYFSNDFGEIVNSNDPVALLCHSGKRSNLAAEALADKGYNIYNIVGGFEGRTKSTYDDFCFEPFCKSIGDLSTCLGWTDYNLPAIDEDSTGAYKYWCIAGNGTPQQTPIPGTLLLLGSGLVGIIGMRKKRFRS